MRLISLLLFVPVLALLICKSAGTSGKVNYDQISDSRVETPVVMELLLPRDVPVARRQTGC